MPRQLDNHHVDVPSPLPAEVQRGRHGHRTRQLAQEEAASFECEGEVVQHALA
jgi:hypothetical protein